MHNLTYVIYLQRHDNLRGRNSLSQSVNSLLHFFQPFGKNNRVGPGLETSCLQRSGDEVLPYSIRYLGLVGESARPYWMA